MINQAPQNGTNQPWVFSNKKNWVAKWIDEHGIQKGACFNINKFGYEAQNN